MLAALQENLLCLLVYSDEHAVVIRGAVGVELYGGPYRLIATRIYDYIDRYKRAPGDHLADLMADKLEGPDRESTLYTDIVRSIHEVSGGINADYVMSSLDVFVRRQSLRSVAVELTKALQRDTESSLDEANSLIAGATHQGLHLFEPGTRLSDPNRALDFLEIATNAYPTGIDELDKRGFGPSRKELWLLIANTKAGKSWALIHLAKMAMTARLRVCHISLEMSEARCAQRYFQALFAIAKRPDRYQAQKFKLDELGRIIGLDDISLTPRLTLADPQIRDKLLKLIDKWSLRQLQNIIIKQFPTGSLTVPQLKAYLDNLENTERFTPDLLIIDYPDLMKLDKTNFRLALDEVYKDIRGIAVERNIAVAVVSQSHRAAAKAKTVGGENVAEAYSKIAHADVIITYSQTEAEQKLGLARLHVAGGRNDQDKITVVVSQQYGVGAFVIDSALMTKGYWDNIDGDDSEGRND